MALPKLVADSLEHINLNHWVQTCDSLQHVQRPERIVFALNDQRRAPDGFKCSFVVWPRPTARRNRMPEHNERRRPLDS